MASIVSLPGDRLTRQPSNSATMLASRGSRAVRSASAAGRVASVSIGGRRGEVTSPLHVDMELVVRVDLDLRQRLELRFVERRQGRLRRAELGQMLARGDEAPVIRVRLAVAPRQAIGFRCGLDRGARSPASRSICASTLHVSAWMSGYGPRSADSQTSSRSSRAAFRSPCRRRNSASATSAGSSSSARFTARRGPARGAGARRLGLRSLSPSAASPCSRAAWMKSRSYRRTCANSQARSASGRAAAGSPNHSARWAR